MLNPLESSSNEMAANRSRAARWCRSLLLTALATVMLSSSTGCRIYNSFHDAFVEGPIKCYRDRIWGERAFNMRYWQCEHPRKNHLKRGFIDGYCAVCEGDDGYVPAIPPQKYWASEYQTPDGAASVDTWFRAYPKGASVAKKDGAGSYNSMFISKMMESAITQSSAENVLPSDVPVVNSSEEPEQASAPRVSMAPAWNDPSLGSTSAMPPQSRGQTYRK